MSKAQFTRRLALCGLAANAVALPLTISGAIRNSDNRSFQSLDNDTVEFFAAKKAGLIDVMFIPRSSKSANIMMKNRTKRKLSVSECLKRSQVSQSLAKWVAWVWAAAAWAWAEAAWVWAEAAVVTTAWAAAVWAASKTSSLAEYVKSKS